MIPCEIVSVQPFALGGLCMGCAKAPKLGKLYRYAEGGPLVCSPKCHRAFEKSKRKESRKAPVDGARVALIALSNTAAAVAADLRTWAGEIGSCAASGTPSDLNRVAGLAMAIAASANLLSRDSANAREEI